MNQRLLITEISAGDAEELRQLLKQIHDDPKKRFLRLLNDSPEEGKRFNRVVKLLQLAEQLDFVPPLKAIGKNGRPGIATHRAIAVPGGLTILGEAFLTATAHPLAPPTDPHAPYMPVTWFKDEFGLTANALLGHKKRGNLKTMNRDRWNLYSVPDAMKIWPDVVNHYPDNSK